MGGLLLRGRIDEQYEMTGVFKRVTPPLDSCRQPAVASADHDDRVRLECIRNGLRFVAAQIDARSRRDAFFEQPRRERFALDRRQPVRTIDLELMWNG